MPELTMEQYWAQHRMMVKGYETRVDFHKLFDLDPTKCQCIRKADFGIWEAKGSKAKPAQKERTELTKPKNTPSGKRSKNADSNRGRLSLLRERKIRLAKSNLQENWKRNWLYTYISISYNGFNGCCKTY